MEHNAVRPSVCYEVQKIIAIKGEGMLRTYQVEWAPTWISGTHLVGCDDLIQQFLGQQCVENEEYSETASMALQREDWYKSEENSQEVDKPKTIHNENVLEEKISNPNFEWVESDKDTNCLKEGIDTSSLAAFFEKGHNNGESSGRFLNDNKNGLIEINLEETVIVEPEEPTLLTHINRKPKKTSFIDKESSIKSYASTNKNIATERARPDKQFHCDICGKSFMKEKSLQQHSCIHACPYCEKTFLDKRDFQRHLRVHTGEKPFKCTICQKEYKRKDQLGKHLRDSHAIFSSPSNSPYRGKTFLT